MHFDLDKILISKILFCMENQDANFVFDTQEGNIIDTLKNDNDCKTIFDDTERFLTLPGWDANDGYRLMEKFTSELKNPVTRQELSAALNSKKGVFRAFKNVLEQYPETEKQWFNFKENKMKNEIIVWYNSYREEWGLKPIGTEPEDTSSLILEDFIFKKSNGEYCFTAETAEGEFAGSINAELKEDTLHICNLKVNAEYQGMGLGKTLLLKLLEKADTCKFDVTIDLPSELDFFSRSLLLEEFKPCMQRFIRKKN